MANLTIEQRITHYFLAMGAQQSQAAENERFLSFTLGSDTIRIVMLGYEDILSGSKVIDIILRVASLRGSATLLYLAAPKLFGTIVDTETFHVYGLGLLLFDDRKIEETVTAQSRHDAYTNSISTWQEQKLLSEYASLRSMYAQMERSIEDLREELKVLGQNVKPPERELEPNTRIEPVDHHTQPYLLSDALPSFFNNNPWVDVLSRRGKTEMPQFAG